MMNLLEKKASELDQRIVDKPWRLTHLYKIKNKSGQLVTFQPTENQKVFLFNDHLRRIALKARQLGMSTACAIDYFDDVVFTKNINAAIVADKEENAENIFEKVLTAWDNFPAALKTSLQVQEVERSKSHLKLSNGSLIKVGTTIHSGTYQRLHLSEYGPLCATSPEKAEQVKKSALPTVPSDGKVTIESTAEGEGNDFHTLCVEGQDNNKRGRTSPLSFRFFFFPWYNQPEYELNPESVSIPDRLIRYFDDLESKLHITLPPSKRAWYTEMERTQKIRMREQYPSTPDEAFLASGDKLFNPDIIRRKIDTETRQPTEIRESGALLVYQRPRLKHVYGIGGDVAQGIQRDSCTAQVIDFTTNELVATYCDDMISPTDFAHVLAHLGFEYNVAIVAPESNNHGHATIAKLVELEYPNIYQFELKGVLDEKTTQRLGWLTSATTKPRMMHDLNDALQDEVKPLTIPDEATLQEALMYRKDETLQTSVFQQKKLSRHSDRLMALAIANQMRSFALPFSQKDDLKTKARITTRRNRNRVYV